MSLERHKKTGSMWKEPRKRYKKMDIMSTEARKPHKKMKMKANELPLSLIESEILPRLPAKSIGRCKCVCKQWKSFLSTPTFARMHLDHVTINDYKLLLLNDDSSTIPNHNHNHNRTPNPRAEFIVASLDGLVCLASRDVPVKLTFWNPLTGAYKKLSSNPTFCLSFGVAYYAVGFYIDSSNDYKLLYLVNRGVFGAFIYSHRLDSWRKIVYPVESNDPGSWSPATFCGQCLYFVVTATTFESKSWIICFDVSVETFRKIQFPAVPGDARGNLVVLNGCIHLCVSYTLSTMSYRNMWRLDGDGWVKIADFIDPRYDTFRRQYVCSTSIGNWLAILENNSLKKLNAKDFTRQYWYFCSRSWAYRSSRMIYVETLVSPNS